MTHDETGKAIIEALGLSPYAGRKLLDALDARYVRFTRTQTRTQPTLTFESQGLLELKCACGAPATRYTAGVESDGPIAVCDRWAACSPVTEAPEIPNPKEKTK